MSTNYEIYITGWFSVESLGSFILHVYGKRYALIQGTSGWIQVGIKSGHRNFSMDCCCWHRAHMHLFSGRFLGERGLVICRIFSCRMFVWPDYFVANHINDWLNLKVLTDWRGKGWWLTDVSTQTLISTVLYWHSLPRHQMPARARLMFWICDLDI